jgi:hypothetical protein
MGLSTLLVGVVPKNQVKTYNGCKNDRPYKTQHKRKFELFADDPYCDGAENIKGTYSN